MKIPLKIIALLCPIFLWAQQPENKGWLFLSHTQKIDTTFSVLADAQIRSTDNFDYINTLLLRTALIYNFNSSHSAALGYVYKGDWSHEDGAITRTHENRIFEQYMYNSNFGKSEFTLRGRFEQRFVRDEGAAALFSQRARAFVALQIPIFANADFSKGLYVNLQNEVFLNVHNKQNVNNDFFDQNRLLGSLGYRWSKSLDTEIGYMYWRQSQADGYLSSNVVQLMITSSF